MRKIIASFAFATLSIPIATAAANAQVAQPPVAPAAAPAKVSLGRLVAPSNPTFQRQYGSTETSAATPTTVVTAWETIVNDASLTEFASLVRAAGLESIFSRTDGIYTYFVPTNDAFTVLDQRQLARLKEPAFKEQLGVIVRQFVTAGRFTLNDATRRLPTNVPAPASVTVQNCSVVGGVLVSGIQVGGTAQCSAYVVPRTAELPAATSVLTETGTAISVRASVIPSISGPNHYRVTLGNGAAIETADYPVKNGVLDSIDTLPIPTQLGKSLTDIVGRY